MNFHDFVCFILGVWYSLFSKTVRYKWLNLTVPFVFASTITTFFHVFQRRFFFPWSGSVEGFTESVKNKDLNKNLPEKQFTLCTRNSENLGDLRSFKGKAKAFIILPKSVRPVKLPDSVTLKNPDFQRPWTTFDLPEHNSQHPSIWTRMLPNRRQLRISIKFSKFF